VLETNLNEDADTTPGITRPLERPLDEGDDPFAKTTVLPPDEAVSAAEPGSSLQVGSVLRDRFVLQARIAGGSMGVVYKALDRRLAEVEGVEPTVAIKVLSPQLAGNAHALRALQQEAAKGRCLTHPNIVRFIDFDREDNTYFIVMEWLEGRSLADILDAGELPADLTKSLDIVRQTGEALAYAHRCGVVHADVKPGNIMISPSGTVKLYDFGIARVRQQQKDGARFDPGVLGAVTPAYSSMQVLTGEEPTVVDDVFSLACLAYRLIAGHRVFGPRNAAEAAESGMEPQRPHNLPDAQWKALRKALSHSRVARYATPFEFLDALLTTQPVPAARTAAREEPLYVPDDAVVKRRFAERRRRWWPYLALPLLVAAIAATMIRPSWVTDVVSAAEQWLARRIPSEPPFVADTPVPEPEAGEESLPPTQAQTPPAEPETSPNDAPPTGTPPAGTSPAGTPSAGTLREDGDAGQPANEGAEEALEAGTAAAAGQAPATADDTAAAGVAAPVEDEPAAGLADAPPETGTATDRAAAIAESAASGETAGLVLAAPGEARPELDLTLNEGGEPVSVDVYRWFGLDEALTVRIDEVGFSGNRSPRDGGQYLLSGDSVVSFDPGQRRATLEIHMPDDQEREPDQQVSLLFRDYYNVGSELGMLNLSLLDDDQRAFEAGHEANTIAFGSSRMAVSESDPAVQIDVLRLNPDQRTLTVRYRIEDDTAIDGEDYFSPGNRSVTFGPGQRTARLLIPLVQDAQPESDETFYIELDIAANDSDTIRRIAVIIRDDD
jgi:serine/threonine protein kinase